MRFFWSFSLLSVCHRRCLDARVDKDDLFSEGTEKSPAGSIIVAAANGTKITKLGLHFWNCFLISQRHLSKTNPSKSSQVMMPFTGLIARLLHQCS